MIFPRPLGYIVPPPLDTLLDILETNKLRCIKKILNISSNLGGIRVQFGKTRVLFGRIRISFGIIRAQFGRIIIPFGGIRISVG